MKIEKLTSAAIACAILLLAPNSYARSWEHLNCGSDWTSTKSAPPVYPKRAQQRGLEGSIEMSFTINVDGTVADVDVVEASRKVFVRSATKAVSTLEFPPCIQNGLATRLTNVSIKFDFNLK